MHFNNFGKRFCAYMLDVGALAIVFQILGMLNGHLHLLRPFGQGMAFYLMTMLYFSAMESSSWQATAGKRLLGLTVCRSDNGEKISFVRALVRNVARLVNMPLFCLGYVLVIFTKKHQGLHDFIARTTVVDESEMVEDATDDEEDSE